MNKNTKDIYELMNKTTLMDSKDLKESENLKKSEIIPKRDNSLLLNQCDNDMTLKLKKRYFIFKYFQSLLINDDQKVKDNSSIKEKSNSNLNINNKSKININHYAKKNIFEI